MQDVGRKIASGAVWMVLFKLVERSLGFVSTLILARLLVPADFGLVAMATALMAMMELLTAFGFDWALIQRADAERRHFDTAWTMNILCGLITAVAMVALAVPIARFYSEPDVTRVVLVLAIGPLVQGFENIGTVYFRKDLAFKREFLFQVGKKLAMFAITIPLAWWMRSYWALVAGIVTGKVMAVVLSYRLHPYRPRFSMAAWADLIGFSKWLLINNLLLFVRERGADFIIGRLAGARALGIFTMGAEIANLPTTQLVAPINRAVYPGYTRMAGQSGALRSGFLSVVAMIALLGTAAGTGIAAVAPLLVKVLLGERWMDSVPVMQIVAFAGVLTALQTNSYSVYLALGRPDLQTRIQSVYVALLIPLILLGMHGRGLEGAAAALLLATALVLPLNYGLLMRRLELKLRDVLAPMWRPLLACVTMYYVLRHFIAGDDPTFRDAWGLLAAIGLGMFVYAATIALVWLLAGRPNGAERMIATRIAEFVRARTRHGAGAG